MALQVRNDNHSGIPEHTGFSNKTNGRTIRIRVRTCIALLALSTLLLPGSSAKPYNGSSGSLPPVHLSDLSKRYLTHISTDKPIYQIGEKVYVRGVMLNAANNKPLPDGQMANTRIEIKGPKGETLSRGVAILEDSVWSFEWPVATGMAGGEYKILMENPSGLSAPAERKFEIRAYRAPRLSSHIKFLRDGYGPGEKVSATLEVKRAEGGIPEGAKVSVNALVDGVDIKGSSATVDAMGNCSVNFTLPAQIEKGEGTLALTIEDGGVVETASKTIPILLQTVDVQMYPEGGDLVSGFKNRLYVQAMQPNGKPADIEAVIISSSAGGPEQEVAKFHTVHEGRGRVEFVPDAKRNYSLKVLKPEGINKQYPLPTVLMRGAVLRTSADVIKKSQPLTMQIGATGGKVRVAVSKHNVEVASKIVTTSGHKQNGTTHLKDVTIALPADLDGVLTVTVYGDSSNNKLPLAERLVFREPTKPLKISITSDKQTYVPGDNAEVKIKATDSDGKPVSAMVGVTVTDDSILQMVEKREQAPQLPVMVFLEPEVKDLADAQVYLDPADEKAPVATDLLLGTQGWRRFALLDPAKFLATYGNQAKSALAAENLHSFQHTGVQISGTAMGANAGATSGVAVGAPLGTARVTNHRIVAGRIGETGGQQALLKGAVMPGMDNMQGRTEGPRDMNIFQVEPTVIDERHYTSGRAERHQKTSPTLPEGAPIPDNDGSPALAQIGTVDRYTFFGNSGYNQYTQYPVVRVFAHQVRPDRKATDRHDFQQTLYWNAAVKTDDKGEGTINFGLSDSVTTFKVLADGFSQDGALGASTLDLIAVQPFYAEAKLPLQVTAGDQIFLPISLINATADSLKDANVSIDLAGPFRLLPILQQLHELAAGARARCLQPIEVGFGKGLMEFVLKAKAGSFEDKVTRQLSINPKGFPIEKSFGGTIEPGKNVKLKVNIESSIVPGSLSTKTELYTSPLSNLTSALERMIQEPSGCFEQTSSTSYPLTMAQQYFLTHSGVSPKLVADSSEKLDRGYKQLLSFWCPDRGYEWFGENPGHEALTAFGLLHFSDMAQVREVDQKMISSTREWLLKQRDGSGGFTRKRRALHTWIEDKDCSNAYILWALLETGQSATQLQPELRALKIAASDSRNSYVTALAANVFYLADDKAFARQLMQKLASLQKSDGSLDKVTSSIVGSGGESLEVEGTALAGLAWLRDPQFAGNVERSMKFLADSCKAGRYGSTQATVLALRTIVKYDKEKGRTLSPGRLRLVADGQPIGDWVAFDKSSKESVKLPDLAEALSPGEHTVEIQMEGGSPIPYSLAVKYNKAACPDADKECKLTMSAKLSQEKLVEGTSTDANVMLENTTNEVIPSPVAIIGIPGGLEPRHDQLKELVKRGVIDAYEVTGRQVVFYWRTIPANAKLNFPLSMVAAVPGSYTGPASRAYLYYTDEHKNWVDGMHVEIAAK